VPCGGDTGEIRRPGVWGDPADVGLRLGVLARVERAEHHVADLLEESPDLVNASFVITHPRGEVFLRSAGGRDRV
jgi:hypothetical protein